MERLILWICLAFALTVTLILLREDWLHLVRPARMVSAKVVGHRSHIDDGGPRFAALLEFPGDDGRAFQVEDKVLSSHPTPEIGSVFHLHHPEGMPKMARIRRPVLRTVIYLFLLYLNVVLVCRLMGWLSAGAEVSGL
jgi:hypothetical protein